jgi:hypothetical protein
MIKRHVATRYILIVSVYNKFINYLDYLIVINDDFGYSQENDNNDNMYKKKNLFHVYYA